MPRKKTLPREPTSIRLTPEAKQMLSRLSEKNGLTQAAWLESMIRREAKREKVTVTKGITPADSAGKEAARNRFLALLEKAQRHAPDDMTPEELEHEVTLAFEEVRAQRRANGG